MTNCEVTTTTGSRKFRRAKLLCPKNRSWTSQINLFLSLSSGHLSAEEPFIWNPVMWFQFKLLSISLRYLALQRTLHLQMYILIQSVVLFHSQLELLLVKRTDIIKVITVRVHTPQLASTYHKL